MNLVQTNLPKKQKIQNPNTKNNNLDTRLGSSDKAPVKYLNSNFTEHFGPVDDSGTDPLQSF